MDGRRRKQEPPTEKKNLKNPQTNIKKLKKDIETLETKVNYLLEHVEAGSIDSICIVCENPIKTASEYHDLPCQHVLCEICVHNQIKNHRSIHCPHCSQQPPFFPIRSVDSSSSSEEG